MTKILAISGGVDSMVMLDLFCCKDIVIAHFNHGTRDSSSEDAHFVANYAKRHHHSLMFGDANLGENASEATARDARYRFLYNVQSEMQNSAIFTAHHLDDLVESIIINFLRGTGWRGLAVLDAPGIVRPFLEPEIIGANKPWDKKMILKYAAEHNIVFRQDPTNCEDHYLRNRVRKKLIDFPDQSKQKLYELWRQQKEIKRAIDQLVLKLLPPPNTPWQRSWFNNLNEKVALELLRAGTSRAGISATRPQLENFLQAIKTYAPGTYFNLPNDKLIKFTKTNFIL